MKKRILVIDETGISLPFSFLWGAEGGPFQIITEKNYIKGLGWTLANNPELLMIDVDYSKHAFNIDSGQVLGIISYLRDKGYSGKIAIFTFNNTDEVLSMLANSKSGGVDFFIDKPPKISPWDMDKLLDGQCPFFNDSNCAKICPIFGMGNKSQFYKIGNCSFKSLLKISETSGIMAAVL